jgi:hypothetical protein
MFTTALWDMAMFNGLFYYAFGIAKNIASNGMIDEKRTEKDLKGSGRDLLSRHLPGAGRGYCG